MEEIKDLEAARKLCKIYFNIASEAIGEENVRIKRDAMIEGIIVSRVELPVSQENGGFNIHTSKEEYEEDGETKICFIAHSTFLDKDNCYEEGETRLEAVKKYLEEALQYIKYLETEGHGEKLNKELEITERNGI